MVIWFYLFLSAVWIQLQQFVEIRLLFICEVAHHPVVEIPQKLLAQIKHPGNIIRWIYFLMCKINRKWNELFDSRTSNKKLNCIDGEMKLLNTSILLKEIIINQRAKIWLKKKEKDALNYNSMRLIYFIIKIQFFDIFFKTSM